MMVFDPRRNATHRCPLSFDQTGTLPEEGCRVEFEIGNDGCHEKTHAVSVRLMLDSESSSAIDPTRLVPAPPQLWSAREPRFRARPQYFQAICMFGEASEFGRFLTSWYSTMPAASARFF